RGPAQGFAHWCAVTVTGALTRPLPFSGRSTARTSWEAVRCRAGAVQMHSPVMRGLDPAIHQSSQESSKKPDGQVEPAPDGSEFGTVPALPERHRMPQRVRETRAAP